MDNCIKNCSNCKHRDKFITEEPCFICKYTEEWEPADAESEGGEANESTN